MRNIVTIARRELGSLFVSPIAYVILIFFTFIVGYFFVVLTLSYSDYSMRAAMNQGASELTVDEHIIRNLFSTCGVIMLFFAPMISMRVLAEERRLRTAELLLTSPVSVLQLVAGKYLGILAFGLFMLGLTLVYPLYLTFMDIPPDPGPLFAVYLGTGLMMGAFLAIGLFCSSVTSNQIIAAVGAFAISLFFWIVGIVSDLTGAWGPFLASLSLSEHFNDFLKGVIEIESIVYYVTFIAFGLFMTSRVIDSSRWR